MPQKSAVSKIEDEFTIALTGAALHSVGPIPRKNVPIPSLRYDFIAQSRALEYFRPGPMTSVCNRDLITSVVSESHLKHTDWIGCQPHRFARSGIRTDRGGYTEHRRDTISTLGYLFS